MYFIHSERGSSTIGWILILPVLFFFTAFGFVYFYFAQVRSCVAIAVREGAREYGIQLGQGVPNAEGIARSRALNILIQQGMLPSGASFLPSGTSPRKGERGASITFFNDDDGTWVRCTIVYYLPNPLPTAPRLLWEDSKDWWPDEHFVFRVSGSAKIEYY